MTNDWVQGHLAAINDIKKTIDQLVKEAPDHAGHYSPKDALIEVQNYLADKKKSLKELVEKLNKQAEKK